MKNDYLILVFFFFALKAIYLRVPILNSVNLVPYNQSSPIKKLDYNFDIILALTTTKKLINWNGTTYELIPSLATPVNSKFNYNLTYLDFSFDGVDSISLNALYRVAVLNLTNLQV
jgi:hypothetical protein